MKKIHQEGITMRNLFMPNEIVVKHRKQKMIDPGPAIINSLYSYSGSIRPDSSNIL